MGENGIFFSNSQVRTMYGSALVAPRHLRGAPRSAPRGPPLLKISFFRHKGVEKSHESALLKYKWVKMESFLRSWLLTIHGNAVGHNILPRTWCVDLGTRDHISWSSSSFRCTLKMGSLFTPSLVRNSYSMLKFISYHIYMNSGA